MKLLKLIVAAIPLLLIAPFTVPAAQADDRIPCGWTRVLYNDGEPVNSIRMSGFIDEETGDCKAMEIAHVGRWSDGPMFAGINYDAGQFVWHVDDRQGVESSFLAAWSQMPALLTHPDHFEDIGGW